MIFLLYAVYKLIKDKLTPKPKYNFISIPITDYSINTEYFDYESSHKVRKYFNGNNKTITRNIPLLDHPLIARKYQDILSGEYYTVKTINKHWYRGWYLWVVMDDINGSSRATYVSNINSHDKDVIKGRQEFKIDYVLIEN